MTTKKSAPINWEVLLAGITLGKTIVEYDADRHIFDQGQPADSIFYVRKGKVKLAVVSPQGKEVIVATLSAGEFLGEGCLAAQPLRMATAIAITECQLFRIEKSLMLGMIHEKQEISELFVTHLLSRNIRYESDLVDQLFNSSEKGAGADPMGDCYSWGFLNDFRRKWGWIVR